MGKPYKLSHVKCKGRRKQVAGVLLVSMEPACSWPKNPALLLLAEKAEKLASLERASQLWHTALFCLLLCFLGVFSRAGFVVSLV